MTKSVQIQITKEALETLKGNHYKLCFAKKVKDVYDVVWQSFDLIHLGRCRRIERSSTRVLPF